MKFSTRLLHSTVALAMLVSVVPANAGAMEDLVAAAQKEGELTVIALPRDWCGYGKVIEIEHANEIRTVYGHLSRFARGLRQGERVDQGEIIGYVGMTGLATGPHLHYEYLSRGVHKDPQKVPLPNDQPIPASRMAAFREHAAPLVATLDQGSPEPYLARQAQGAANSVAAGTAGR